MEPCRRLAAKQAAGVAREKLAAAAEVAEAAAAAGAVRAACSAQVGGPVLVPGVGWARAWDGSVCACDGGPVWRSTGMVGLLAGIWAGGCRPGGYGRWAR